MTSDHKGSVEVTPERLRQGARNAASCMGIQASDRVFIITDDARADLAGFVATACVEHGAATPTVRRLEEYGPRPLTVFPDTLRADIAAARPTVTYYIATAQPGELGLRRPLLPYLAQELRVRHGHMIGITPEVMADAMCADYDQVFARTMQVYDIVKAAHTIHVTSTKGSDVVATFRPDWRWVPCHGRYWEQGMWGNLPEGEVYTAPAALEGRLVADVLGDYFSARYGVLAEPVTFVVADSHIAAIETPNTALADELRHHFWHAPNGRRAGEYAIGTLEGLAGLTGNLLQDEKMPGLHVAFGNPYPEFTGADWASPVHVDCVTTGCTITVDGRTIMRDGQFTL
jgi:leucyl aminopeptidase (aminopeptidase T)